MVKGLDSCQFTLTALDIKAPFVELKDTEPFTYLFDNEESSLIFEYKMKEKEDVSFNLVGPLNELNLYVLNEDKSDKEEEPDWNSAELDSDGFIKYNKDDIKSLDFRIKV